MSDTKTPRTEYPRIVGAEAMPDEIYVPIDRVEELETDLADAIARAEKAEAERDALAAKLETAEAAERSLSEQVRSLDAAMAAAEADAERLRAVCEHGWYIGRNIEGDWQVKLHLAIDAAIDAARGVKE